MIFCNDVHQQSVFNVWNAGINFSVTNDLHDFLGKPSYTTNIFQFLTIFAQNLAILPHKQEVPHFPEVYQTFSYFWNITETNHSSWLLYSENSHDIQHKLNR